MHADASSPTLLSPTRPDRLLYLPSSSPATSRSLSPHPPPAPQDEIPRIDGFERSSALALQLHDQLQSALRRHLQQPQLEHVRDGDVLNCRSQPNGGTSSGRGLVDAARGSSRADSLQSSHSCFIQREMLQYLGWNINCGAEDLESVQVSPSPRSVSPSGLSSLFAETSVLLLRLSSISTSPALPNPLPLPLSSYSPPANLLPRLPPRDPPSLTHPRPSRQPQSLFHHPPTAILLPPPPLHPLPLPTTLPTRHLTLPSPPPPRQSIPTRLCRSLAHLPMLSVLHSMMGSCQIWSSRVTSYCTITCLVSLMLCARPSAHTLTRDAFTLSASDSTRSLHLPVLVFVRSLRLLLFILLSQDCSLFQRAPLTLLAL
jgi:hypothetical protein